MSVFGIMKFRVDVITSKCNFIFLIGSLCGVCYQVMTLYEVGNNPDTSEILLSKYGEDGTHYAKYD